MAQEEHIQNSNVHDYSESRQYSVILPCDPADFGQFVSGLLGKPQTIEKTFRGTFEITHDDVTNTFSLVDQRIHQQNEAVLLQFTVKIIYDDDSSVLLNSLNDFIRYTEVRPLRSIGGYLSWIYLVKFQQKTAPEKQQIDLSFRTSGTFESIYTDESEVTPRLPRYLPYSEIFLRINHTERTWGIDIESLLTGHVKTLMKKQPKYSTYIYKNNEKIGFAVAVLFFLGAMIGVLLTIENFIHSYLTKVTLLSQGLTDPSELLIKKIDFLTQTISAGVWPQFIFYIIIFIVVSLTLSIFLGVWVANKANNRPHSFVLLSKKAEEYREHIKNKRKRDWILFGVSIVTSIITGVISNLIFSIYFGKF